MPKSDEYVQALIEQLLKENYKDGQKQLLDMEPELKERCKNVLSGRHRLLAPQVIKKIKASSSFVGAVSLSQTKRYIAASFPMEKKICVWDVTQSAPSCRIIDFPNRGVLDYDITFGKKDNHLFLLTCEDTVAYMYDITSQADVRRVLRGHNNPITGIILALMETNS